MTDHEKIKALREALSGLLAEVGSELMDRRVSGDLEIALHAAEKALERTD